ncbi:hypothetical protein ACH4C6_20865 [Streptomyces sp. NPDC017943]|uniref:hypothetical protein n=1 Tax=Streptomyces sp. NPDC017943 TaxID=3365019 RepID=UPI00379F6345
MNGEKKRVVMTRMRTPWYGAAVAAAVSVVLLGTWAGMGTGPQRDMEPDEISSEAVAGVRAASSVRVRMEQSGPEAMDIDLAMDREGRCAGRISSADGTADVIRIGGTLWLKPDVHFWKTQFGDGGEVPPALENRYLRGGTEHEQLRGMAALCDLGGIQRALARAVGKGPFVWAEPVASEGRWAKSVSDKAGSVLVSTVGGPRAPGPVRVVERIKDRDTVTTTFTDWNRPVAAKAPAPGTSIDLDRLP